jgi:hypothetical protein
MSARIECEAPCAIIRGSVLVLAKSYAGVLKPVRYANMAQAVDASVRYPGSEGVYSEEDCAYYLRLPNREVAA